MMEVRNVHGPIDVVRSIHNAFRRDLTKLML
jgi:hypothetical protein